MTSQPTPPLADKSVVVVLGTRPEIIKLGHIVRLLGPAASIVHTGQHFEAGLSQAFFDAFDLPEPAAVLGVGGSSRGVQLGEIVTRLDGFLDDRAPDVVIVQGDTNSAAAGALAANAREIPLLHVEAGLRSFDRRMPEESNRIIADHLADRCCAPTEVSRANLLAEGIADDKIVITGNTVVEAVASLLPAPEARVGLLAARGLTPAGFILSTFHRPENVDDPTVLGTILQELASLPIPVILPLHPRTRGRIAADRALTELAGRLVTTEPMGYAEFLGLAAESAILISDSGGIQEEASVLKRPVLVVRRSTERPEVLGTFAELIAPGPGISAAARAWLDDLGNLHRRLADIGSPYGDGSASDRIVGMIRARGVTT
jgi:UDP-N-acetylglucosamine 2-epimerase (non-hydrolysing)